MSSSTPGSPAPPASPTPAPTPGAAAFSPAFTLVATCLGLFLGQVDTNAINLALPDMARDLSGGIAGMQWTIDAYNVAFAALLLTGGTLGDRHGRRRLFRIGISVFILGSVACALAPNLGCLIAGRAVQGVGSAALLPQSLAILATAFPGRRERNRAMAAWSMVAGFGLAAGPTLGGLVVDKIGWQYIFWLNVPIGLVALLLAVRQVPESRSPRARAVDPGGQVLGAAALGLTTFAVVDGGGHGRLSPATLVSGALAVVAGALFLRVEHRHRDPMLPLGLVRRGQLPVATAVAFCMNFGMYALFMLISLDFQNQRGDDALVAGLLILPVSLTFALSSPLVGRLVTRRGPRLPMTAGMALMGLGLLAYAAMGVGASIWAIEVALVVIGAGLGLNAGPVVGVAVRAVSADRAGLAGGIANLARISGAALGVAVGGSVLDAVGAGATHGPAFTNGLRAAFVVGAAAELIGMVVAFLGVRNPAHETEQVAAEPASSVLSGT